MSPSAPAARGSKIAARHALLETRLATWLPTTRIRTMAGKARPLNEMFNFGEKMSAGADRTVVEFGPLQPRVLPMSRTSSTYRHLPETR